MGKRRFLQSRLSLLASKSLKEGTNPMKTMFT
uniref:Uncharacterized protein n=1 Tax=Anguilla anguilla TaxID=7936 RepID=A0A0E9V694_ANGAN